MCFFLKAKLGQSVSSCHPLLSLPSDAILHTVRGGGGWGLRGDGAGVGGWGEWD